MFVLIRHILNLTNENYIQFKSLKSLALNTLCFIKTQSSYLRKYLLSDHTHIISYVLNIYILTSSFKHKLYLLNYNKILKLIKHD
jgi:hypothetical protein